MTTHGDCPIFRIQIFVEPDEDVYHAYCPALTGLHTCGNTVEEAISNAEDAARAYLQSLIKHNEPLPIGICPALEAKQQSQGSHTTGIQQHTSELELAGAY